VRLNGRDRVPLPPPGAPIVVRDGDRIPVVPVADDATPQPAAPPAPPAHLPRHSSRPAPSERQTVDDPRAEVVPVISSAAPGGEARLALPPPSTASADVPGPGFSSVRDPRAVPAYQAALTLARSRRCGEALDAFSAFLVRWPDHPYAENAMYWRGECLLAAGDARHAASEFEGQLRRFPIGAKAPDALYKLVVCYRRLGEPARAGEYRERLLHDFGGSDAAARLRAEGER
jgi:tol-pal system protein YbgF